MTGGLNSKFRWLGNHNMSVENIWGVDAWEFLFWFKKSEIYGSIRVRYTDVCEQ